MKKQYFFKKKYFWASVAAFLVGFLAIDSHSVIVVAEEIYGPLDNILWGVALFLFVYSIGDQLEAIRAAREEKK